MSAPARRQRKMRTFSAFGDVRKMPSEYEIVTHAQNWNTRKNRLSAFEQNPSSPMNLWFLTYREHSPLQVEDWEGFKDPDQVSYRTYVGQQADEQTKLDGILDSYNDAGADAALSGDQVARLGSLFAPSRYLVHGCQMIEAYIGYMGHSSYITSAAGYANADFLRRVTMIGYRTRELQIAHPDSGIGTGERQLWEQHAAWQPARKAIEQALVAYDFGEAFTALNLVLAPTLDDVLVRQFGEVSRASGDELAWLLGGKLKRDNDRRGRWSGGLARFCVQERPSNTAVLNKWIDRWAPRADAAVEALAPLLGLPTAEVVLAARQAREAFHGRIFDGASGPAG